MLCMCMMTIYDMCQGLSQLKIIIKISEKISKIFRKMSMKIKMVCWLLIYSFTSGLCYEMQIVSVVNECTYLSLIFFVDRPRIDFAYDWNII